MNELQQYINNNVCSYCGGSLEIQKINDIENCVCMPCSRVNYGVKPEIYNIAVKYLESDSLFNYYYHLMYADEEYRRKVNLSKLCDMIVTFKEIEEDIRLKNPNI